MHSATVDDKATHVDAVKAEKRERCRKRQLSLSGARIGRRKATSERPKNIIEVAAKDRRATLRGETIVLQERLQLFSALALGEPQMKTCRDDFACSTFGTTWEPYKCLQGAPLFSPPNLQVNTMGIDDWVARQHGIAVAPLGETMLRREGEMLERCHFCQPLSLKVAARRRPVVGDLLKKRDVRIDVVDDVRDSVQKVATIEPANPLVDIPTENRQMHAAGCPKSPQGRFQALNREKGLTARPIGVHLVYPARLLPPR